MRHGDDIRRVLLMRQYPDFPIEFIEQLYRLDRLIEEAQYIQAEKEFLVSQLEQRRKAIEEKAKKELEKK